MLPNIQTNTVEYRRLCRLYAARLATHPAFAAYPTLDALASVFHGSGRADLGTRTRLLAVVVAEHRATPDPLGPAIVLHAFHDMLAGLSRSLLGVESREEADAVVVSALLEALTRVHPERDPDRLPMYMRQETRRAAFTAVRQNVRGQPPRADGEEDPDAFIDPDSETPIEERLALHRPTVTSVTDAHLLRASEVRGGLRRLTDHLFEHVTRRERENAYRQLRRRANALVANGR